MFQQQLFCVLAKVGGDAADAVGRLAVANGMVGEAHLAQHTEELLLEHGYSWEDIEQHVYLGVQESLLEAASTWERLRNEGDILVPTYDPLVFERFPDGVIA